jgi:hypothetical protein
VSKKTICVVCAYRESCQKKFSAQKGRNCPDFERDLSIKEPPDEQEIKPETEPKGN